MANNEHKYDDIINLKYPFPSNRKRMSIENRAFQFAPFSALNGYTEAIKETARFTNKRIEIADELKEIINIKLQIIKEQIQEKPIVTITYFVKDFKKSGGEYLTLTNIVKKVDENNQTITLENNIKIPMSEIISITSETIKLENDFYE